MRSRTAPNARVPPVPMAWTPATSRQALPAIFCTTFSATVIVPSPVASRSRGAGMAVAAVSLAADVTDWFIGHAPSDDDESPGYQGGPGTLSVRHGRPEILAPFSPDFGTAYTCLDGVPGRGPSTRAVTRG